MRMNKQKALSLLTLCGLVLSQTLGAVSTVYAADLENPRIETTETVTDVSTDNFVLETSLESRPRSSDLVSEPVTQVTTETQVSSQVIAPETTTTIASTSEIAQTTEETTKTDGQTSEIIFEFSQVTEPSTQEEVKALPVKDQEEKTSVKKEEDTKNAPESVNEEFQGSLPYLDAINDVFVEDFSGESVVNGSSYVEKWTGKDAYTHNLLSRRYGITAEQLDGFLANTGIKYDANRINGTKLLEWERISGLDVRAIVAIAIMESSLGTEGVASQNRANMFGYGAFDNNPDHAQRYRDDVAIKELVKHTIIKNKNTSFKIQDDKAIKHAKGQLDIAKEGGVYFTDASGSGKRRAEIMERLNKWIDEHGGTPKIPEHLKVATRASVVDLPEGYSLSRPINPENYITQSYPFGQCTWYVYNRALEMGISFDEYMGNGADWQNKVGYETSHTAKVGHAISFAPGQAGADSVYGHVAIVEEVRKDGSILISESNAVGLGKVSYRTFSAAEASQLTYVHGR